MLSAWGARAVALARGELEAFFLGLDLNRPELARDALLEFLPILAQEYGDVAATAAAEWYEAQRAAQIGGSYAAVLGDGIEAAQAEGSVRYAAGHLFGDDPMQTLVLLSGSVQRFVLYGSRDTIARNAEHDPERPRFARVPTGAKTCAWCSMLASRGFVYMNRETAGIARDHYHDDCDCQVVAEFDKDAAHIDGYDPDGLYDQYMAARQATGSGNPKVIAAEMRRRFPDSYTDGVFPPL